MFRRVAVDYVRSGILAVSIDTNETQTGVYVCPNVIGKSYTQSAHKKALVFKLDIWRITINSQLINLVWVWSCSDFSDARIIGPPVSTSRISFRRTEFETTTVLLCLIGSGKSCDTPGRSLIRTDKAYVAVLNFAPAGTIEKPIPVSTYVVPQPS